jgi:hypothetical protein
MLWSECPRAVLLGVRCISHMVADRKKIDKTVDAFETFCVGAVNVTYERYVFNRRQQESGERFDVFLDEVRRLGRTCQFGDVEESMILNRIVAFATTRPVASTYLFEGRRNCNFGCLSLAGISDRRETCRRHMPAIGL